MSDEITSCCSTHLFSRGGRGGDSRTQYCYCYRLSVLFFSSFLFLLLLLLFLLLFLLLLFFVLNLFIHSLYTSHCLFYKSILTPKFLLQLTSNFVFNYFFWSRNFAYILTSIILYLFLLHTYSYVYLRVFITYQYIKYVLISVWMCVCVCMPVM